MGWSVAVAPVGTGRYAVFLLDMQTLALKGPDGGEEHQGYTADELRPVLRTHYELSDAEIDKRIAAADYQQSMDTWREAQSAMLHGRLTGTVPVETLAAWGDLCAAEQEARAAMDEAAARVRDGAG